MITNKPKTISCFMLVMFIVSSIDNIRNLPATALFGNKLIFFFLFSAIVFLIPTALVSAELASAWSKEKGIYHWVKLAFGEHFAFLTIWLQWINTMIWFPTILSFLAGAFAYLIDPALAQNKAYLVTVILTVFWTLTIVNLRGIHISARFATICALIGMVIPMVLISCLGVTWVALGHPMQIHLSLATSIPHFGGNQDWVALTAIMTAFLGMELAAVHVNDIRTPQKTYPKAMLYSVILILITMIMGSLAIAFVMPRANINLVAGTVQAFQEFFAAYHLTAFTPLIIVMILIGTVGQMINWIVSPAKGLLQAAKDEYLPAIFRQENKNGVANVILLTQAILVSFLCLGFLLMPSINGSYWLLTDLSTQIYMLMYVLLFFAGLKLKHRYPKQERPFAVPGGVIGFWLISALGLVGCVITLIVGFFPPSGIDVGGKLHYEIVFTFGMIVMVLPVIAFYYYKKVQKDKNDKTVDLSYSTSLLGEE